MSDPLGLISPSSRPIQPLVGLGGASPSAPAGGPSFRDVLMKNIEQVNRLQQDAQTAIEDVSTGKRDDLAAVMTAKQKADLAFQMLQQVRNKMMEAYQEVQQIRV